MRVHSAADFDRIQTCLRSGKYTSGSTHNFYLYPARFSPEIARAVIETFSDPGDWVLDPFMGGGTAIVEGLALGRSMMGVDLNALAHFVASVRTRPLSLLDEESLRVWAHRAARGAARYSFAPRAPAIENLPASVRRFLSGALAETTLLFPRRQAFARCVLLRLGQWALDCRDHPAPSRQKLAAKLPNLTEAMLNGLREFTELCSKVGLRKGDIVGRRVLRCGNGALLHEDPVLGSADARPRLVFTSPPYPSVHVLYHRWQVRGRKETPAPYWIAQVPDGYYASHYTGGSRTLVGERNYFSMIRSVFASVRKVLATDGIVVQLVGFADVERQLPKYLATMGEAGFDVWPPTRPSQRRLWRRVPNRKWHARLQGSVDASSELLLCHRPR